MKYVFAYYTNAIDNMDSMDKAADHVMSSFDAKPIGRGTYLPTSERDIQWLLPDEQADAAAAALEKVGFRSAIKDL